MRKKIQTFITFKHVYELFFNNKIKITFNHIISQTNNQTIYLNQNSQAFDKFLNVKAKVSQKVGFIIFIDHFTRNTSISWIANFFAPPRKVFNSSSFFVKPGGIS